MQTPPLVTKFVDKNGMYTDLTQAIAVGKGTAYEWAVKALKENGLWPEEGDGRSKDAPLG